MSVPNSDAEPGDALAQYQSDLRTDGGHDRTAFGSPEHGTVVELLMCDRDGLDYTDGEHIDARRDGTSVQIKACQAEHANGGGKTVTGRWDAWSESLMHLLADDGEYLLVVYDGDVDPCDVDPEEIEDYVLASRYVDADEFGAAIDPDAWHDGQRPSKGDKARVFWTEFFDADEVEK